MVKHFLHGALQPPKPKFTVEPVKGPFKMDSAVSRQYLFPAEHVITSPLAEAHLQGCGAVQRSISQMWRCTGIPCTGNIRRYLFAYDFQEDTVRYKK